MRISSLPTDRRSFLSSLAAGAAAWWTVPGAFAEELSATPALTEGPFYPDKLPLDKDNDLIIVGDNTTPAVGEITHLTGRILNPSGEPLNDADIEIWQCDANAVYLHSMDSERKADQRDRNFQGYGRFTTGAKGEYRFRTIKPVPYPGRPAPHIHFKVSQNGRAVLTSQFFINGHAGNKDDMVFLGMADPIDREFVMLDFVPMKDSRIGELSANMDIVIGRTPPEREGPDRNEREATRSRRRSRRN
jgi:protocatechuate 3,4-dioxygenase, beta subunit